MDRPTGWVPLMPAPLKVRTGELMYGAPLSYALATPTRKRRLAGCTVAAWALAAMKQEQKWLRCGYGAGDELTLLHRLPGAFSAYSMSNHRDAHGSVLKIVICSLPLMTTLRCVLRGAGA